MAGQASDVPPATLVCCGLIGTVIADDGLLERTFTEAIATQGIVPGTSAYARCMAQVHRTWGRSTGDVLSGLFPDNQAMAQAAQLSFDRSYAAAIGRMGVSAVPGAQQALEKLSGTGLRICLLTGLSRRLLALVMDAGGWRGRVNLALSADDVPRGAPAPDLPLCAMLRLGVGDVRETVVADGTGDGVASGRRSGAGLVAGVLTGPHAPARLRQAGASQIIDSIGALPDLLAGMSAAGAVSAGGAVSPAGPASAAGPGPSRLPAQDSGRGSVAAGAAGAGQEPQVPLERRSTGL
jgi:phosphoglycolate phosphatase